MRYSFALTVLAAIGAQAAPQASYSVQPISQISDGQIQAPPATPVVPGGMFISRPYDNTVTNESAVSTPAATVTPSVTASVVVPSEGAPVTGSTAVVVVPSEAPSAPVGAPSAPAGNSSAPVDVVTSVVPTASPSNGTVSTGSPSSTSAEETSTPSSSSAPPADSPPAASGAATGNMVSFGGLALAIAAALA